MPNLVAYTDEGRRCGESHPRAHIPDCIVHEIRDRAENRAECMRAVHRDLTERGYQLSYWTVFRVARYMTRAAVPHEWRKG